MTTHLEASCKGKFDNEDWLTENKDELVKRMPETWTHFSNWNSLPLRYYIKVCGVDWRSDEDWAKILTFLTRVGMLELQTPNLIRGNTSWTIDDLKLRTKPRDSIEPVANPGPAA